MVSTVWNYTVKSLVHSIWTGVDAARLTGWVKPGENWQLNVWIWILQAKENYFGIQYSMKIWTVLRSFYLERLLFFRVFAHSHFTSTYHVLAFPILIFCGIAFRIKKKLYQIGNRWYFQLVEEKFFLARKSRWKPGNWLIRHRN